MCSVYDSVLSLARGRLYAIPLAMSWSTFYTARAADANLRLPRIKDAEFSQLCLQYTWSQCSGIGTVAAVAAHMAATLIYFQEKK